MAEEQKPGCARPTGGLVSTTEDEAQDRQQEPHAERKEVRAMIQVGKPAPDFVAPAYYKGTFTSVKLSDYLGKWVVLCFYPGDFTFV